MLVLLENSSVFAHEKKDYVTFISNTFNIGDSAAIIGETLEWCAEVIQMIVVGAFR